MALGAQQRRTVPGSSAGPVSPPRGATSVIPFDQAARFELRGIPGNIVQDVINIDSDGVFVAVGVSYGLLQERGERLEIFNPVQPIDVVPGEITLADLPVQALVEGFRLNPRSENIVFQGDTSEESSREPDYSVQPVPQELANKAFQLVRAPAEVAFLFSVVDSASGRELQDEPTHNLASLGSPDGRRPFRPLAQPLSFLPRSTVRLQIVERTSGIKGSLFIVLYGYKMLTGSACPEPVVRSLAPPPLPIGSSSARVIPFDYVSKFTLTSRPGHLLEDEVPVNVEGMFVATSIGYGLAVESDSAPIVLARAGNAVLDPNTDNPRLDLSKLPIKAFPPNVLREGIKIRADYLRIVLDSSGALGTLRFEAAQQVWERLNKPEDVSFLYTISDTGVARDWQNRPIHNVAGLGIANGLRPFKKLAYPRVFQPRSTIRVTVEERFGSGTLFLTFQGYKVLGSPPVGVRS